jgi:hypothetical protein
MGNPVPAFRVYEITGPGKLRNLFFIISLLRDDEILPIFPAPSTFVLKVKNQIKQLILLQRFLPTSYVHWLIPFEKGKEGHVAHPSPPIDLIRRKLLFRPILRRPPFSDPANLWQCFIVVLSTTNAAKTMLFNAATSVELPYLDFETER